ncbi:tyrosine-type recombinase/integrase [Mycobacterium marseillense]|uniref:tyrosine-type recombinase/integrase n=1 Tax=Mycobacterium marseillense TaxID=701042 RepID=UPI0025991D58|nr:site-specific integrase [Mycobacterium marseillense]MDM3973280.1 tyrosine-type recombinase/integrase [Mycobacterium marseillense]
MEDRWRKADGTPSANDGRGNRWRARYVDEQGREHAKGFARKVDAQRWLDEVTAAVVTGQYVDPQAGRVTFREYAERWRTMQMQRPSSRAHIETMLRRHAYPTLGDRPLSSILPSDIQAWIKGLELAPATIGVVHGIVSTIMKSAIRDRRIVANPCDGSKLPKVERKQVVPLTTEEVAALREALPPQLQALVTLAAGTGMRQGECLGLTVDRVRFLERAVIVDRQLVTIPGQSPTLGPPKTQASNRTIPLPQVVVDALAVHLSTFPAETDGLVFTLSGKPITRPAFGHKWRPAVAQAGLSAGTGFHALRHYYASLLIRHGESVKTVQARLGHASAVETLDTYSHLWPDSDDRTRDAVDSVLGVTADALRTAAAPPG